MNEGIKQTWLVGSEDHVVDALYNERDDMVYVLGFTRGANNDRQAGFISQIHLGTYY